MKMPLTKTKLLLCCLFSYAVGIGLRDLNRSAIGNLYLQRNGCDCVWPQRISFEEKIAKIAQKVGDWQDPAELFRSRDFHLIYRHPLTYQPHVIRLLTNRYISLEYKKMVLYGMEQLDLKQYLDIITHCYRLYQKRVIPLDLLALALCYRLAGDHPIVKHYQDPAVAWCLNGIASEVHALQPILHSIRNGDMWQLFKQENIGSHFHWSKLPLPFIPTIDALLKSNHYAIEQSDNFMILYEHPEHYIQSAHQLLENPLPELEQPIKNTLNGLRNELVCNTLRKLDPQRFVGFLQALFTLYPYDTPLSYGTESSCYKTLLLHPYPLPTHLPIQHNPTSKKQSFAMLQLQKHIHFVQKQQRQEAKFRKLYNIQLDASKPFYHFDGVEAHAIKPLQHTNNKE